MRHLQAVGVRWTSRSLGLSSDSSYRYERGVDPHTALDAARRALDLITVPTGLRPALATALGDVVVVGDVAAAQLLIREHPTLTAVTADGAASTVTGGTIAGPGGDQAQPGRR